jgi:outer membrane protein assembly factor BamB
MALQLLLGWVEATVPDTGAMYYYNAETGETTWERPIAFQDPTIAQDEEDVLEEEEDSDSSEDEDEDSSEEDEDEDEVPFESEATAVVEEVFDNTADIAAADIPAETETETEDPMTLQLLPGWVEAAAPDTGAIYYFNAETGESSWERPIAVPSAQDEDDAHQEEDDAVPFESEATATVEDTFESFNPELSGPTESLDMVAPEVDDDTEGIPDAETEAKNPMPLLPGWTEATAPDTGALYYFNAATGETTWERPTALQTAQEDDDAPQEEAEGDAVPAVESEATVAVEDTFESVNPELSGPTETLDMVAPEVDDDTEGIPEAEMEVEDPMALLPGWTEATAPDTGAIYYFNAETGESSWERPIAVPSAQDEDDAHREEEEAGEDAVPFESEATATVEDTFESVNPELSGPAESVDMVAPEVDDDTEGILEVETEAKNPMPLLPGWAEATDPGTGEIYYFNEETGESGWERPTALDNVEDEDDTPQEEEDAVAFENEATPLVEQGFESVDPELLETEAGDPMALLPGWAEATDPGTGEIYYFNEETGDSGWERPTVAVTGTTTLPPAVEEEAEAAEELDVEWEEEPAEVEESLPADANAAGIEETDEWPEEVVGESASEQQQQDPILASESAELAGDVTSTSLPDGWAELTDPTSGSIYYYHAESGETAWDIPEQATENVVVRDQTSVAVASSPEDKADEATDELQDFSRQIVGGMVDELVSRAVEESQPEGIEAIANGESEPNHETCVEDVLSPESVAEADEQTLPEGWEAVADPASGQTYYYNANDGQTSWDRPVSSTLSAELEDQDVAPAPEEVHGGAPNIYESTPEDTNAEHDDAMMNPVDDVTEEDAICDTHEEYGENPEDEIEGMDDRTGEIPTDAPEATGVGDETPSPLNASEDLPPGWVELEHEGKTYYYNESNNETTWEKPVTELEDRTSKALDVAGSQGESLVALEKDAHDAEIRLPAGWTELFNEDDTPYYWHEESNETSWERPVASFQEDANGGGLAVRAAAASGNRVGRPKHAIATFAFGGRLCVCRASKKTVTIHRSVHHTTSDVLASVEIVKQRAEVVGPLNTADHEAVGSYIEERALANPSDLLWNLIMIASKSNGRLRSEEGVDKLDSPEAAVVQLLLRDSDASPSNGNGNLVSPDNKFPSAENGRGKCRSATHLLGMHVFSYILFCLQMVMAVAGNSYRRNWW